MITVIKHGDKKKIECEECGALLRYQIVDIAYEITKDANNTKRYFITCPDCRERVYLEGSK